MAYIKQNFTDGVVLEAHHLNNIEDQIAANEAAIEGKADKEHTHNYAGSSSAGGSALSAEKVNNALTINVRGDAITSGVYNGSEAMEFNVCSPSHTHDNVVSLDDGIRIETNADLNMIVDIGNYRCTNPKTSETLLNCPTQNSFKMTVAYSSLMSGGTYKIQEIVDLYQREFYRRTVDNGATWTEWEIRGIGLNTSIDVGEAEYNQNTKHFTDEMNRMATRIGMTNSSFNTACGFDDYTTAYDLLRLLIAARHTPTVYQIMGTRSCRVQKNNAAIAASHIVLEHSEWKNWAQKNNYTLLATKGGSFRGVVNGTSLSIMNSAMLIKDNNNKTYGLTVVGVENQKAWLETITYSKYERVKVETKDDDGKVLETHYYMSLTDNNLNHQVTDTTYWQEVESEATVIRTLMHDMIEFLNGKDETQAMQDAAQGVNRRNKVSMAGVILTDDGTFEQDIQQLEIGKRMYYNKDIVRFAASTTKIMTAIVLSSYLDNHFCSVVNDDIIGGSGHAFVAGDTISTNDALYMMLLISDNTMANMLARDCGRRMSGVTKEWVTNEIASVSGTVSETWVNNQIQTAVTQKADKVHTHTEYADSSHTHSMSDITSGTLSLSQGGTGTSIDLTNAPANAIIKKAGEGYNSLYYTATKNGAYYATSENGAPKFGILPIAQGGTGATTPAEARSNLYPTLTSTQKKQIQALMRKYYNVGKSKDAAGNSNGPFMYYGNTIRNSYANNSSWVETQKVTQDDGTKVDVERKRFGICCNTFVETIWMGRKVEDFLNVKYEDCITDGGKFDGSKLKCKTKEEYSNEMTLEFDWGYYPEFTERKHISGLARLKTDANDQIIYDEFGIGEITGYYRFVNPNSETDPTNYKYSYSATTLYDPEVTIAPCKQWFHSFMTQADLAYDLYRKGYSIPVEELDVGDLIFNAPPGYHRNTELSTFVNDMYYKNIGHVSLVYDKDENGVLTIIECTDAVNNMAAPIVMSGTNLASGWDKVQAEYLLKTTVMCARHPAAWGHSNIETTKHSDGKYYIDYMPSAMQHGFSSCPIIIEPNADGSMPATNIKKDRYYVFKNTRAQAKEDKMGVTAFTSDNFYNINGNYVK